MPSFFHRSLIGYWSWKRFSTKDLSAQYITYIAFNYRFFLIVYVDTQSPLSPIYAGESHPETNYGTGAFGIHHHIFRPPSVLFLADKLSLVEITKPGTLIRHVMRTTVVAAELLTRVGIFGPTRQHGTVCHLMQQCLKRDNRVGHSQTAIEKYQLNYKN